MHRGLRSAEAWAAEMDPLDARVADVDEEHRHGSRPHSDVARDEAAYALRRLQHQRAAQVDAARHPARDTIGSADIDGAPAQRIGGTPVLYEEFETLPLELD